MKLNKTGAEIFVPDGTDEAEALARTTHLAVAAHQDDIELMAAHGILECFGKADKFFTGIVTADGAGSPRKGIYGAYTGEEMIKTRALEQKKAAFVGEYSAAVLLNYSSKEIKDRNNDEITAEYIRLFEQTVPEVVYTHNLADKHDTHVAVAVRVIEALRQIPAGTRPKKVYGCEVWRDLDWLGDKEKAVFDLSGRPSLLAGLISVFDSQICGGKRYDLAAQGRRAAHATYGSSHGTDTATEIAYAMDLTPLIHDESLDVCEYIVNAIDNFKWDVIDRIEKMR